MSAGEVYGQYRVTRVIGRGGMGVVYAGEHTMIGRAAAIKVLRPEVAQRQDLVARFFNEAKAASAIRHQSIVEIYDVGWNDAGAAYIVMELLHGETLSARRKREHFTWQQVLHLGRQITAALQAAHAVGIVHRDLKPDNIMLAPDPEVPGGECIKLLDFGIAKLTGEVMLHSNLTQTGAVLGTPRYMSPEQCRGVAVDHRSDLYSLGCNLYELMTRRPPFVGEGMGDILTAHVHLAPPTLAEHGADAPQAVEDLIAKLLAKSPADRYASATELMSALDNVLAGVPADERTPVPPAPSDSIVERASAPTVMGQLPTTLSGSAVSVPVTLGARSKAPFIGVIVGVATIVAIAIVMLSAGGPSDTHGPEPVETKKRAASPAVDPPAPLITPIEPEAVPTVPAIPDALPTQPAIVADDPIPVRKPVKPIKKPRPVKPGRDDSVDPFQ